MFFIPLFSRGDLIEKLIGLERQTARTMLSVRDVDHMNSSVEHKAATALVIEITNFEKSPPTSIRILFPSSDNPHTPSFLFGTKKKLALKGNRGD